MTSAVIYGPWPAGSAGTVSILEGQIDRDSIVTVHKAKGRIFWTVIRG